MGSVPTNQIIELLVRWTQGESAAREELVPLVYGQLRRMARHFLAKERPDHTLQSAALVHEAYLRLVGHSSVRSECERVLELGCKLGHVGFAAQRAGFQERILYIGVSLRR